MVKDTNQEYELENPDGSFECFVNAMRSKIRQGTERHGDFTQYSKTQIFDSLVNEWRELLEAIQGENEVGKVASVSDECVDVANLAYMLYWAYIGGLLKVSVEIERDSGRR